MSWKKKNIWTLTDDDGVDWIIVAKRGDAYVAFHAYGRRLTGIAAGIDARRQNYVELAHNTEWALPLDSDEPYVGVVNGENAESWDQASKMSRLTSAAFHAAFGDLVPGTIAEIETNPNGIPSWLQPCMTLAKFYEDCGTAKAA